MQELPRPFSPWGAPPPELVADRTPEGVLRLRRWYQQRMERFAFPGPLVDGHHTPSYLDPEVPCESSAMRDFARVLPVGRPARWFWCYSHTQINPDATGNRGCWVLCIAGARHILPEDRMSGRVIRVQATTIPYWEQVFLAVHPLFPRMPLLWLEQVDQWMRLIHPIFQAGRTAEERARNGQQRLIRAATAFFSEAQRRVHGEIAYGIDHERVMRSTSDFIYSLDSDSRARSIRQIDEAISGFEQGLLRQNSPEVAS